MPESRLQRTREAYQREPAAPPIIECPYCGYLAPLGTLHRCSEGRLEYLHGVRIQGAVIGTTLEVRNCPLPQRFTVSIEPSADSPWAV